MNMDELIVPLCYLVLLFFTFSVLGWCMEVVLKFQQYHRFINRGFLAGPYLPIYGAGVVFITVMVNVIGGIERSIGTTFVISFIGCGALEYLVSYCMEKRFHARWWDYSQKPMNLNGRIWIGNLVWFGIGGTVINTWINPFLYSLFERIPLLALYISSGLIVAVMLTDYVVSHFVMKFVKTSIEASDADNTESIRNEITLLMRDKSILYQRIADAYPEVVYRTDKIIRRSREIRENLERIQQEQMENMERIKQNVADDLKLMSANPSRIQDQIIEKQDRLIVALTEGNASSEELALMKEEVEERKDYLQKRRNIYSIRR